MKIVQVSKIINSIGLAFDIVGAWYLYKFAFELPRKLQAQTPIPSSQKEYVKNGIPTKEISMGVQINLRNFGINRYNEILKDGTTKGPRTENLQSFLRSIPDIIARIRVLEEQARNEQKVAEQQRKAEQAKLAAEAERKRLVAEAAHAAARREALLKQQEEEQRLQDLPHLIVQSIINETPAFRSATFIGTWRKTGVRGTNYRYEVECLTEAGLIRISTFDVLIRDGKCIEVYVDGAEFWMLMIGPPRNYRNP